MFEAYIAVALISIQRIFPVAVAVFVSYGVILGVSRGDNIISIVFVVIFLFIRWISAYFSYFTSQIFLYFLELKIQKSDDIDRRDYEELYAYMYELYQDNILSKNSYL